MPRRFLLLALSAVAAVAVLAADQATHDQVAQLFKERKWAEARTVLEKLTATEPGNAEAWQSLGQACLALSDHEKAVPALEKATQLEPANSLYHCILGDAYGVSAQKAGLFSKLGLAKKCKAAYDKAVELDPRNLRARWSVMEYCRLAPGIVGGGMEQAYVQAAEIRKIDAGRGRAAFASLYIADRKYDEAFGVYEEVLREKPGDDDALFNLGRVAALSGQRLDRGLAALRELLTHEGGQTPRAHTRIGNILEKQGDKPGARAAYERAIELDPKFTPALEALRKLGPG